MGKIVACFGVSHAPGQTSWPDLASPAKLAAVRGAWSELRRRLGSAKPDVLVAVSNDHQQNFFPVQPPFCVGNGESHLFPAPVHARRLKLASRTVPGHPEFAELLLAVTERGRFPLSYSEELEFIDEISIPLHFLDPEGSLPVVPILTNCLNRHQPSPATFVALGEFIAEAVDAADAGLRVAVIASGGLAHDPLGPNWCIIDEAFDRRFLQLVAAGDKQTLLKEFTLERILAPGKGGTPETLNWFAGLGVADTAKADVLCYEPVPEWATGMGFAAWRLP